VSAPVALVELIKDALRDPSIGDEIRAVVMGDHPHPANERTENELLVDVHGGAPSRGRGPDPARSMTETFPHGTDLTSLTAIVGDLSKQVAGLTEAVAAQSPLVDLKTAANHLGVSTRTVRRMVAADQLPYRRLGRTLRFSLALLAPKRRGESGAAPPRVRPSELGTARRRDKSRPM
jgi:excisionase family DNA binding protein